MKIMRLAVIASLFFCSNVKAESTQKQTRPTRASRIRKHPERHFVGHRPMIITDEGLAQQLAGLEKIPHSEEKLIRVRRLLTQGRKQTYTEQNQEKFNQILQDAYKNCDQTNQKELNLLIGILHFSQQSPLLGDSHKENIDKLFKDLIEKAKKSQGTNLKTTMQNLQNMDSQNDYKSKIQSTFQLARKIRGIKAPSREMQSEFSAAIQDVYSNRPMDDSQSLTKLRDILTIASNSLLLSTIKQYEVKEIFIPNVLKNIEKAKQLAQNTVAKESDNKTA
jgi:hypothetical protein